MNDAGIRQYLQPLLDSISGKERKWLNKLLTHRSTYELYTSLDNEIFVQEEAIGGAVLIASTLKGEGRTTTAIVLATLTAALDSSRRILLIDGDVQQGRIAKSLGVQGPGLKEYFQGQAEVSDIIQTTPISNLAVIPQSQAQDAPIRLHPKRFAALMEQIKGDYDLIVVDSPAGSANKDLIAMASIIKSTIMTIKYAGPTREQVTSVMEDLERVNANLLGCVINQRDFSVPRLFYGSDR